MRVESLDRLDEGKRCDLHQVFERLPAMRESSRQKLRQSDVGPHQPVAEPDITGAGKLLERLLHRLVIGAIERHRHTLAARRLTRRKCPRSRPTSSA